MYCRRREFLRKAGAAAVSLAVLGGCTRDRRVRSAGSGGERPVLAGTGMEGFLKELEKNRKLPPDLVMKQLDQKADRYMSRTHHCAQSSFMALQDQFSLPGDMVAKALTPLPGIAERGKTCGAVTGPLMALGLVYGRGRGQLENWEAYQQSLDPAGDFCDRFEEQYDSLDCHQVQEKQFGRCYELTDPEELRQFQEDGATEHCSQVVRSAVRMAAGIILSSP